MLNISIIRRLKCPTSNQRPQPEHIQNAQNSPPGAEGGLVRPPGLDWGCSSGHLEGWVPAQSQGCWEPATTAATHCNLQMGKLRPRRQSEFREPDPGLACSTPGQAQPLRFGDGHFRARGLVSVPQMMTTQQTAPATGQPGLGWFARV